MEFGDSPLGTFSSFRSYDASDPRDKVYALLNVIAFRCKKKPSDLPILPDYNRQLPEVLLEATRYCLSFHGDLRFFWYIENEQHRRLAECPSWTIDLAEIMFRYPFALSVKEGDSWNPSGETVRETPDNSTPNLLKFKAAKVCSIVQLSTGTIYTTPKVFDFRSFVDVALQLGPEYGTDMGQGITEILWRTITADRVAGEHPAPSLYAPAVIVFYVDDFLARRQNSPETAASDVAEQLEALHAIDPGTIMPTVSELATLFQTGGPQLTAWQTQTLPMVASTTNASGNRLLARTSSNHLGLVPSSAKVGDEIWVIPGMPTPFVFRRLDNGNHEIIGEAYVHGIMRGEMINKLQFKGVVLE
jgi:hypothetical protein